MSDEHLYYRCKYSDDFDSARVAPADIFIQWKGTDVCGDFHCECGENVHVCNAEFLYRIHCDGCGTTYEMPHTVPLRKIADDGGPAHNTAAYRDEEDPTR
jgi:hypothetical protein